MPRAAARGPPPEGPLVLEVGERRRPARCPNAVPTCFEDGLGLGQDYPRDRGAVAMDVASVARVLAIRCAGEATPGWAGPPLYQWQAA
eukprot:11192448-Prorocentrum_lima.AAC.1